MHELKEKKWRSKNSLFRIKRRRINFNNSWIFSNNKWWLWRFSNEIVKILKRSKNRLENEKLTWQDLTTKFKKVNRLITSGIYKYSRNPMYLGLLMIVMSTSIFYLNIFSITTPMLFYFWINRFQIKREEIFLTEKFGKEYLSYKNKTRRWI